MYYPFNPSSHYNKFGYYRVGDDLTYSKWDALNRSQITGHAVEWIFNDEIYSKIDWTKEPEISLDHLYRLRAEQLRQNYDYIVIMYSGGADSHNVLMSFLSNNIHVDEVAHYVEFAADPDPNSFANAEVTKVAWPTTKKLLDSHSPTTVHRTIDISDIILNLHRLMDADEYLNATTSWMSPNCVARSFIRETVPDYQNIISSGKKLCLVWGADPPLLATLWDRSSDQQFYAGLFGDRESCLVSPRQKYLSREWEHDELFYWSPDLPELVSKQCHILRKQLMLPRHLVGHDHFKSSIGFVEFGWILQQNKLCILSRSAGQQAIYPHWNVNTFSNGKTRSRVFSDRDAWLFKDMSASATGRMFQSVVERASKSSVWRNNTIGWPASYSRLYPIQDLTNKNLSIIFPFGSIA